MAPRISLRPARSLPRLFDSSQTQTQTRASRRAFYLPPRAAAPPQYTQHAGAHQQHQQHQQPTHESYTPTPFITEQVGGTIYTSDIFSRLLKERIIVLNGAVNDALAASIVAQLLFLEADSPAAQINLYINSPGGSVTAGMAIYDTMSYIRSPVSTICIGQAASMGSLLLAGGAAGKRFALPNASVMIHQPSGGYFGQASDIAIHAKEILRVRERLNKIYERHLKEAGKPKSLEEIEKLMERDYFMAAEEARDVGIVDAILERREDAEGAEERK